MPVRINKLKRALREGKTAFGSFVRLPEPGLVEILGYAGFEAIVLDAEHGAIGKVEIERMSLAAYASGATPIARVLTNEPRDIMQALDLGAMGVLVPHIRTGNEACAIRSAAFYPPRGQRGVGMGRPGKWGAITPDEYFASIDDEVLVMCMVEDREAIENIDEIAAAGLDVLFVGTADLAASLGRTGQFSHAEVLEAGSRVVAAARKYGAIAGFPARNIADARQAVTLGYRLITFRTVESYVFECGRQFLDAVRRTDENC